jgi:uncharacterized protein YecE (DUF72 family)
MAHRRIIAGAMQGIVRVGPAGWVYPDWSGPVYPVPRPRGFDPLAAIARWFDLVEIDSTFYAHASPRAAQTWVRRVESNPRFRFTAKVGREFTHDTTVPLGRTGSFEAYCAGIAPLRESGRLAALLAQFPHSFRPSRAAWDRIAGLVSLFEGVRLIIEVRRAEWAEPAAIERMASLGAVLCHVDQPRVGKGGGATVGPDAFPPQEVCYVRLHGRNAAAWFGEAANRGGRYDWLYDVDTLREWAARIRKFAASARESHVVFNNHFRGKAVVNALMIRSMLEERRVDAPEGLVDLYPDAAPFLAGPGQGRLFQ